MDYNIWYEGVCIGNIKAMSDSEARRNARKIYGPCVTVTRV